MLSWIPILGPIVDGIVSIFNKRADTGVANNKIDADVRQAEIASSIQTLLAFKDDIAIRITRDIVLFPVAVWTALTVWDKIVAIKYPELVWGTSPFIEASGLAFLPYAVMTFLFGIVAVNTWKRK